MNNILKKQNIPNLIELLKAQKIVYNQCKKFLICDIICLIIALLFPFLIITYPNYKNDFYAFIFLWTASYLMAEHYRINKAKQGAIILEQFDTELYNIKWNSVLCNDKMNIKKVIELSLKYSKNDLQNWYSTKIDSSLPKEILILLCQRINFSYEIFSRQKFVFLLFIITILYYIIYIIIGFKNNISFLNFLGMLSSSISFFVYSVLNVTSFRRHIKIKNKTLNIIDNELDKFKHNALFLPKNETLRQIQDMIFIERTVPEKVPNWFYRLNASKKENNIDNLIIKIQRDVLYGVFSK